MKEGGASWEFDDIKYVKDWAPLQRQLNQEPTRVDVSRQRHPYLVSSRSESSVCIRCRTWTILIACRQSSGDLQSLTVLRYCVNANNNAHIQCDCLFCLFCLKEIYKV